MRHFKNKKYLISLGISIILLAVGICITSLSITYATRVASGPVTDIILSNTKPIDVDALFVYGPLVLWIFAIVMLAFDPKKIPFTFKSLALYLVIRAVFASITHIGPFPIETPIAFTGFMAKFASGSDLFFSNHTGLPFLLALINWQNKTLRYIYLATSVFFGTIVLLGHYHYSIDVLGAFFITYSIFHIALYFFKKDWILLNTA